jgi:hypothetical protein
MIFNFEISFNPRQPIIYWTLGQFNDNSRFTFGSVSEAMGLYYNGTLPVIPTVRLKTIMETTIIQLIKNVKLYFAIHLRG